MQGLINFYADLENPDFGNPYEKKSNKKPISKNPNVNINKINNNKISKPITKPINKPSNINNNKNIKVTKPINKRMAKPSNNKNINKITNKFNSPFGNYGQFHDDNDAYDDINYIDNNIIEDPLSMFNPGKKNQDSDNGDKNITPGSQDRISKIDTQKIESIISSLNDATHKYKSISELQSVLKDISIKYSLETEESKAFLIYVWLAKNLSYYVGPNRPDNTPLGALQKRITQCSGYARLFKELLKIFNIKSVLVHGIGRTYNLNKPHRENHEWNAIKLNGKYYLCDVTWGSGKVENNKFVKNYNTFYFCCPPDRFIYTHLPSEDLSKWSLINKNISQIQFENLLYKDKYFYFYGFNDIEPGDGIVKLKNTNSFEVKFDNLKDIKNLRLSCKIIYENKFFENISYAEKFEKENNFIINLIFNRKDHYNILYFATDKSGTATSELITRQKFIILSDTKIPKYFPRIFTFQDDLHII